MPLGHPVNPFVFGGIVTCEALAERVEKLDQVIRTLGDRNGDI
jgi:hypothetical protein